MMKNVDPKALFARIADELPEDLREHLFVIGSLAAARHFADSLAGRGVKTKDAGLVVHPAGDTQSAGQIARHLLELGWRRKDDCYAQDAKEPAEELRAIRLYPPEHNDYFRERSDDGIDYASPCMMALANLLSHVEVGTDRMSTPIGRREVLRSAKDRGRVLALARLVGRDATEKWWPRWQFALQQCFPDRWRELASRVGSGLRDLLADDTALEEAWFTCDVGLLNGKGVTADQLEATAH